MATNAASATQGRSPSAEVKALVECYRTLRRPDDLSVSELLKKLNRDAGEVVLPAIQALLDRGMNLDNFLLDLTKETVRTDKPQIKAALSQGKKAQRTMKEVSREIEEIDRELENLPATSEKRPQLLEALSVRGAELEFLQGRIRAQAARVDASIKTFKQLLGPIEELQHRLEKLRRSFLQTMFRFVIADAAIKMILALPVVLALVVTLLLDRATPLLELVTAKAVPKSYHDVVLLLLFAVQVLILSPITDKLHRKLCWRRFDYAAGLVSSALSQMQTAEALITDAEQKVLPPHF